MDGVFKKALVIGKFMPLHKGHITLIDFAKSKAETVDMLVTAHEQENIPMQLRESWARETFRDDDRVNVFGYLYSPEELNESSESDLKSSHEWADYLGIASIIYDERRENLSISASQIKGDIIRYRDYLAPAVKRHYVHHICICGS